MSSRELQRFWKRVHPDPIEKEFHFDFVTLDGTIPALRVTIEITKPNSSPLSVHEVLERCFYRVWQKLRLAVKAPLAFGQVSTPEGEWVQDLGFEYQPGESGRSEVKKYDRLWFEKAQSKVDSVKQRVGEPDRSLRVELGIANESKSPAG